MELVPLSTQELKALGESDPVLRPYFAGVWAVDQLPKHPERGEPRGYIVNTDPISKPGEHWLGVWTENEKCEVMDSYALDFGVYHHIEPLLVWFRQWKSVRKNSQSLQSVETTSCGDYAIVYLMCKARGLDMKDFLTFFSKTDLLGNDDKVGQMLEEIVNVLIKESS